MSSLAMLSRDAVSTSSWSMSASSTCSALDRLRSSALEEQPLSDWLNWSVTWVGGGALSGMAAGIELLVATGRRGTTCDGDEEEMRRTRRDQTSNALAFIQLL